jgi:hypothetical protein
MRQYFCEKAGIEAMTQVAGSRIHRIAQRFPTKPSCAGNAVERTSPTRIAVFVPTNSLIAFVMATAQTIEMSALIKVDQYVSWDNGTRLRNSLISLGRTCGYPL